MISVLTLDDSDKLYKSGIGAAKSTFQFVYDSLREGLFKAS